MLKVQNTGGEPAFITLEDGGHLCVHPGEELELDLDELPPGVPEWLQVADAKPRRRRRRRVVTDTDPPAPPAGEEAPPASGDVPATTEDEPTFDLEELAEDHEDDA